MIEIKNFEEVRRCLAKDGYVALDSRLSDDIVEEIALEFNQRIESGMSSPGKLGMTVDSEQVSYLDAPLTLHNEVLGVAVSDDVVNLVEDYLGGPYQISYSVAYRTHVVADNERDAALYQTPGVFSGWHSDANILLRRHRCVVIMILLNDVSPGGGAMQVIEGSHLYGSEKRIWQDSEIDPKRSKVKEMNYPKGTVLVFDMELIHRAGVPFKQHRDIVRFSLVPWGGHREPLILKSSCLNYLESEKACQILGVGERTNTFLEVSAKVKKVNRLRSFLNSTEKKISRFLRKNPYWWEHYYRFMKRLFPSRYRY